MKVQFTKYGLKHDYRGVHVRWTVGSRHYLATVVSMYRREVPAAIMFSTRHFNGEQAPDVAASAVEVLERD